ncbi:MAG: flagellar biosynthetic protein FliR [Holosporales bacterium]|jgi:flagellar biosynthetic protein FliR
MSLLTFLPQETFAFLMTFCRVGSLIYLMPGLDQMFVPGKVRLAFAILFSLVLWPLTPIPIVPESGLQTFIYIGQEIIIGVFFGLMAKFLLSTLDVAGSIIGLQTGMSNASLLNPSLGQQGNLFSVFLTMAGITAIFTTDLHHNTFKALAQSYISFPIGTAFSIIDASNHLSRVFADAFHIGIQLAAPLLILGILFNITIGIVSRLMPQVQIFFIIVPAQIIVGIAILAIVVLSLLKVFVANYNYP